MTKGIKNNCVSMNRGDMKFPMQCSQNPLFDTQSHLFECSILARMLNSEETMAATRAENQQIYGSLEEQRGVILILARLLDIQEEVLEERESSLPVGTTGPVIST